jgi:hypothetical protein
MMVLILALACGGLGWLTGRWSRPAVPPRDHAIELSLAYRRGWWECELSHRGTPVRRLYVDTVESD